MPYNSTDIIDHFKQQGEWAELLFMARAAEQGLSIVRPWGDSSPYDVAIEHQHYILRVQIKSTRCHHSAGAYKCHIDSNGVPYREGMLDFIAAYVIPVQVWYIIPFAVTRRTTRGPRNARFSPSGLAERSPPRPAPPQIQIREILRRPGTSSAPPRTPMLAQDAVAPITAPISRTRLSRSACPLAPGEICPLIPKL